MEEERKINWLGLFMKIIIIFIFVLIIIWLVSKITTKTKLSDTFKKNINNMETVATNYYKTVDLPQEKGKELKITLGEMIDKGLIVSENDKDVTTCDKTKSFSKITREKNNYVLSTTLKCGNEKSTITKKFSFKDCKNCSESTKSNNENKTNSKENKDNKDNNNQNNSQNTSNNGITYYEYAKENVSYTKWMKGDVTGDNIENKYEYYGIANAIYYSLGIINESDFKVGNTINYTLKVNSVPNKKYYFSKVKSSSYLINSEESKYLSEKNISLVKQNNKIPNTITKYSLNSNNFTYKLSPYYRKGIFYVDVQINITSTNGLTPYKDGNKNIYFVPLKLDIEFASDEITTTIPSGDYNTITYYRYVTVTKDIIWSSESYVEGYTNTGNSEVR